MSRLQRRGLVSPTSTHFSGYRVNRDLEQLGFGIELLL